MQRATLLEGEARGGGHQSGNRPGGTDHEHLFAPVGGEMRSCACNRRHDEECEESRGTKSPSDRTAEWKQPGDIDAEMDDVAMDERMGEKGPDVRCQSARPRLIRIRVPCRREREFEEKSEVVLG